jgi:hypothetical protein
VIRTRGIASQFALYVIWTCVGAEHTQVEVQSRTTDYSFEGRIAALAWTM